jgi:phage repressor protein C with HTH and peptisase S24 domain
MEPLGTKLRRQRRRLGYTLDELAGKTGISKPYLSLIETGRVPNPPSDEKLRRLEQVLGFTTGELVSQAHLQRTPRDVRAMLQALVKEGARESGGRGQEPAANGKHALALATGSTLGGATSLDDAYMTGVLQRLVDHSAGNVEQVRTNSVPVINRVSAGYPKDFTDLSYPKGVADDYVGCPDVADRDAFAARVHGDSMTPKYREGDIVIFSPAAQPRDGDDCFVRFADGQTTFKRVFFETGEGGKPVMRLQPRNEKYRPRVVPADAVSGLYRAVYRYQRVDQD